MPFTIVRQDITKMKVDVIVNALIRNKRYTFGIIFYDYKQNIIFLMVQYI